MIATIEAAEFYARIWNYAVEIDGDRMIANFYLDDVFICARVIVS